ncbi:hypothetical protein AB0H34_37000 [Saccharopolyspora shandongensis]|uniref:hypothetical protein n=1 Tax=Saccharopolyspora shandongensis TaxID=418495 RepID=UPI0033EB4983
MTDVEAPPTGAQTLVAIATTVALLPWSFFCLLVVVVSLPWEETGPSYSATMVAWGALGVIGLLIGAAQLVIALSGRTQKSVLLRGIPALVLAPLTVLWLISMAYAIFV